MKLKYEYDHKIEDRGRQNKGSEQVRKDRRGCRLVTGLAAVAALVCLIAGHRQLQNQRVQQEIAGKIIRFHVLANSDSEQDQKLKLQVRDAVGVYMQEKLSGVSDIAQSRRIVKENLGGITEKAERVIAEDGYTYPVTASLTQTRFPEKTYGDYTFPAGEYEALELVIGSGEGHNWWCVMYPNMCFFNSAYEVVDGEAEKTLKRTLTPREYKSLMEDKNYEVKFALKDIWEDIKEAVAFSR